jgi:hypothetical protein
MNLKKLVMQTLFLWREKLQSMSECSYSEFLDKCSLFSLNYGSHVYFLCTVDCVPLRFSNIHYLSKKSTLEVYKKNIEL